MNERTKTGLEILQAGGFARHFGRRAFARYALGFECFFVYRRVGRGV